MATRDFRASNERKAYFRLLRYLLSEEVHAAFEEEQAKPLTPRMIELLKTLESREGPESH